ncbi:MAG: energy-coupling factor transporter transmembrane protein EcfT [Oscillospiraceae bacterium]|nr:energy-coupling factor transporter transmembrane protein EcfT [Oscillospiraceae bacterium]
MALKDITLGQYFPGTSILHRLDPRTKILLTVFYIVALFMSKNILGYGLMFTTLVVCILISHVGFRVLIRGMKPILFIVVFTAILNLFYTPGAGEPLVAFWIFKIYWEGIRTAFFMVLRIMMLISCTFLLTYTTSPILLTDALEALLGPLKKLHLPIHELAMMMSIALRFIPTLIEETDKIMAAQKARGADFDSGNLLEKAKALIPLLVPLFISAFRRADELAVAMECRCYHGGEGRTRLRQLKYVGRDYMALILGFGLCLVVWALNLLGVF